MIRSASSSRVGPGRYGRAPAAGIDSPCSRLDSVEAPRRGQHGMVGSDDLDHLGVGVHRRRDQVGGKRPRKVNVVTGPAPDQVRVPVDVIVEPRLDVLGAPLVERQRAGREVAPMLLQKVNQPAALHERGRHAPCARRVRRAHRVPRVDEAIRSDLAGVVKLPLVAVVQPAAGKDWHDRPGSSRSNPGRDGRDRLGGGFEYGISSQCGQLTVTAGTGNQNGDDPVIVNDHNRQVTGVGDSQPERYIRRSGRGVGQELVLP